MSEPEKKPLRPKSDWHKVRTCSRVSSGACVHCKKQTFFGAYVASKPVEVLCETCWQRAYDPEALAKREAGIREAHEERQRKLKLALEGNLPGSTISESGAVWAPVGYLMGMPVRECLREGFYDTEPFRPKK